MGNVRNQKGFGTVEAILLLVIVGIIGGAGWYVIKAGKKIDSTNNITADSSILAPAAKKSSDTEQTKQTSNNLTNSGYLTIDEWGVKIKMQEASKTTYSYQMDNTVDDNGTSDSSIHLVVKPEYLQDKTCDISVGYSRYKALNDSSRDYSVKIGQYYFVGYGSPYNCGNTPDNSLNQSLRKDFSNLQAI